MASSISAPLSLTPEQIAHGTAKVVPSELSQSPLLGILGVIMGAGIVTLTGRMLTLGLADLKGQLGISFDSGAWISSSFNVALMFIGPFTVYLGGLMGPRRILLFAATAFTVVCTFLPLIHSYSLLITALALAGLTSGTFLQQGSALGSQADFASAQELDAQTLQLQSQLDYVQARDEVVHAMGQIQQ